MAVWRALGGRSGETLINPLFVESIFVYPEELLSGHRLRVHMVSGVDYFGYFTSEEEKDAFLAQWSGGKIIDIGTEMIMESHN
jgi:hypothetical protein